MPDKLVIVKTLATETKGDRSWVKVTDQDNYAWYLFNNQGSKVELNKSYIFTFETNEKGFTNVNVIKPLVNIFHQKALKEVANRNDILRNYSVSFSYSKDLVVAGLIPLNEIYTKSDEIYEYMQKKADEAIKIIGEEK
jgi:hypothetical protein